MATIATKEMYSKPKAIDGNQSSRPALAWRKASAAFALDTLARCVSSLKACPPMTAPQSPHHPPPAHHTQSVFSGRQGAV